MHEMQGKVAVVTGGASGIGRGLADRFAEEGMKVVLADIEQEALDQAVREMLQAEHEVTGVLTDVSRPEALEELAQRTVETYGGVHILCNNAGVAAGAGREDGSTMPIWEQPLSDWEWTLNVNLWGVVHGLRAFLPIMLAQDEPGHVVNTASTAGVTTGPRLAIYGVSKHAVVRISEAMFFQLRELDAQVGVSVLCPGGVRTRIAASGRNRPNELSQGVERPDAEEVETRTQQWAEVIRETGQDPAEIASKVWQAIEEERFYIFTHEAQDESIRMRAESMLGRRDPEAPESSTRPFPMRI